MSSSRWGIAHVLVFLLSTCCVSNAFAWMERWQPKITVTPAEIEEFPEGTAGAFVGLLNTRLMVSDTYGAYCTGGLIDLNGDDIKDYVFLLPWMGCGLNASGYEVHFIVSGGVKGRIETIVDGYGVELSDIVTINGKVYFLHSMFFNSFEKSEHNHWVYQAFSFNKDGTMRRANSDFGNLFPAVTIFYENPKFRRVVLTPNDLKNKYLEGTDISYYDFLTKEEYGIELTNVPTTANSGSEELITDIEAKMDSHNSFSQQTMIDLQALTAKRDQSYDMISNILKSLNTTLLTNVNNM